MDLNQLIRPDFWVIPVFLNLVVGRVLKYLVGNKDAGITAKQRRLLDNIAPLIPLVLFFVAFGICTVWGWYTSVYTDPDARWMDALLMCGLLHGAVATSIAVWSWDIEHGIDKLRKGGLGK